MKNDFVEGEAELSGSEDDVSDDEDENELDKLEMEEGDLDDIDEDLVRSQVSRIFARREIFQHFQHQLAYSSAQNLSFFRNGNFLLGKIAFQFCFMTCLLDVLA